MSQTLTETEISDGWTPIGEGVIPQARLEAFIEKYFNVKEDLSSFKRRELDGLELVSSDLSRGYFFVGETERNRNHERAMLEYRKTLDVFLRTCVRSFSDFAAGRSGYSWRKG